MATKQGHEGHEGQEQGQGGGGMSHQTKMYLRFAAMISTSMVVMYFTMFAGTWEWSHVRFSESRVFMALTMGGTMGLVMLAWMLNMYKNIKGNIAIVAASLLLLGGGVFLDRSQTTVDDVNWMSAMIPHHSLAITRSERADIDDVRVCQLAVEIIRAQEREIAEMEWLIEDIRENGEAETLEEALARPVPEFEGSALRDCPRAD
ncbi:DUF305 domain-containing protein [Blastococcus sp. VKM Ac-2987]|uniref:DUF305 domain-containing protein n=1 Tax=Blastococcus sp. VKM Ac-2987 TaxID=3004141 RepID=UPI0022AB7CAD|nr:DUF305 domain-containing protein [Blastococcus sp. VKM Ac-2987]MCZ2859548.1 DUF305 domain-containing protein [Blastococcus sp. VKM Ac-2987]